MRECSARESRDLRGRRGDVHSDRPAIPIVGMYLFVLLEPNTTMTVPNTRKDKTSPAAIRFCQESLTEDGSYRAPPRPEYMRTRRTPLGYRRGCQQKEAVVDQERKRAHVSFGGNEWPRMQQVKTRTRISRVAARKPTDLKKQHKLEW
jgi:hypothetical protein